MDNERYERKLRKKLRKQKLKDKKREVKETARAEKMAEKERKHPGRKSAGPFRSFVTTFLLFFVLFTAVFAGGRSMITEIGDINPFTPPEEVVALETLVDEESPFFQTYADAKKVNVLLIGVNQGMTDTLMLVSFDMKQKKVDVISVPRDTYYHRPGFDGLAEMKINAAYRGKAINTARAVSDVLLGMPINYYAVVEYDGVKNIVDSMGGVPMNIEFDMIYNDPYDTPPLKINIPKGEQILDGEQAVQFLRYRSGYSEGDMGRVKAQQQFMKNAFKQCLGFDLPKIAKTVFNNVESNITLGTAGKIATKAMGIKGDSIETYTIPHTLEPNPPYYVYPDSVGIADMIETIYSVAPETTESAIETE